MDAFQLADWFKWKSMDTPLHYINQTLVGMAENMGIKNIPTSRLEGAESASPKPSPTRKSTPKPKPKKPDLYDLLEEVKKRGNR